MDAIVGTKAFFACSIAIPERGSRIMYLGYLLLLRLSYVSFQEVKSHLSYVNVQNRSDMRRCYYFYGSASTLFVE